MTTPRKAREYLRVSRDRSGRERSQDEQHLDNARAVDQHGWMLGEAYRENGSASASRYARKGRDAFALLLTDLERARFAADVLVIWESSRGSRKVGEWVTLIEACEERGVHIHVTTHSRTYDPANPRDRRSLIEDATDSEYEVGKLSGRSRRAHANAAAAGRPNGAPPYGYVRVYDPETRQGKQSIYEPEATVIRELYQRLDAGHSLKSISQDFAARGLVGRKGRPFSMQHLRLMALRITYAGQRHHKPKDGPETTVAGTWPAIVPRALYESVRRVLTAPERLTRRPGRANHLLTMIAVCDVCSDVLIALAGRNDVAQPIRFTQVNRGDFPGVFELRCRKARHVTVAESELDDLAERVLLGYLARDDVHQALTAGDSDDAELAKVRDMLASIDAELRDLAARLGAGQITATLAAAAEPAILARKATAEQRETELTTPSALRSLITPGKDVARRWKAAPMSARREVARILLAPEILGELRVTRRPQGTKRGEYVPIEERVVWRRL